MDWGPVLANTTALLADVLRTAGDPTAAEARAAEALAVGERIGHQTTIAIAKEVLGRLAAARSEWARAETLLHEALAVRVEYELLGARGERKRPARGWESLTPTELRVVALVAEGLTNPEIGARMFISRGAVKVHLSHIFAKLGIGSRSELAAEATRRELIA